VVEDLPWCRGAATTRDGTGRGVAAAEAAGGEHTSDQTRGTLPNDERSLRVDEPEEGRRVCEILTGRICACDAAKMTSWTGTA